MQQRRMSPGRTTAVRRALAKVGGARLFDCEREAARRELRVEGAVAGADARLARKGARSAGEREFECAEVSQEPPKETYHS